MSEIRLQKYMADAGIASRRKCEDLIASGRVEVNGRVVNVPGTKITENDLVKVDGKELGQNRKNVYIALNKPVGYISTAKDQFSRKTVLDLVDTIKERIYPVGRLDYETSGLILLTNDGEMANKLLHPRYEIRKVYRAGIKGLLKEDDIRSFKKGIAIEDYITAPANIRVLETALKASTIEIEIHEGKNRQVRKMFEALGYSVLRLKRVAFGPISLGGLGEGKWRYLSRDEIDALKRCCRFE